jgi:hypothetical protein
MSGIELVTSEVLRSFDKGSHDPRSEDLPWRYKDFIVALAL